MTLRLALMIAFLAVDSSFATETLPLWGAAEKACGGDRSPAGQIDAHFGIRAPTRQYTNPKPLNHVLFISEAECGQIGASTQFGILHRVIDADERAGRNPISYAYITSPRGDIMRATRIEYRIEYLGSPAGFRYEDLDIKAPEVRSDFDRLVFDLVRLYGALRQ